MTTIHTRYPETDELDSSLSTIVMLIVLFSIIVLSYVYTAYTIPRVQQSTQQEQNTSTLDVEPVSRPDTLYPEPGSLISY